MSTKETRKARRRQNVRDDILEVTRELVLSGGIGNLTLSAIAERLELTKAALYYYFKSKDALLFELVFRTMSAEADAIEAAVANATTGAEAVEKLIRALGAHYASRFDELRLVYHAPQVGAAFQPNPEFLQRLRPYNDRVFGRTAELIAADQAAGKVDETLQPRRTAFVAHAATLGVLTMEALVDVGDDAPLIHAHGDLIDDLVRTHTTPLRRA